MILLASTVALSLLLIKLRRQQHNNALQTVVQGLMDCNTSEIDHHLRRFREQGQPAVNQLRMLVDRETLARRERLHASLAMAPGDPAYADELCRFVSTASPTEAKSIGRVLASLRNPKLDAWLYQSVDQPVMAPIVELRTLAILAEYNPDHDRWNGIENIFDLAKGIEPAEAAAWLTQLTPLKSQLVADARVELATSTDPVRRDQATFVLADLDEIGPRDLAVTSALGSLKQAARAAERFTDDKTLTLLKLGENGAGTTLHDMSYGYVVKEDVYQRFGETLERMRHAGFYLSHLYQTEKDHIVAVFFPS